MGGTNQIPTRRTVAMRITLWSPSVGSTLNFLFRAANRSDPSSVSTITAQARFLTRGYCGWWDSRHCVKRIKTEQPLLTAGSTLLVLRTALVPGHNALFPQNENLLSDHNTVSPDRPRSPGGSPSRSAHCRSLPRLRQHLSLPPMLNLPPQLHSPPQLHFPPMLNLPPQLHFPPMLHLPPQLHFPPMLHLPPQLHFPPMLHLPAQLHFPPQVHPPAAPAPPTIIAWGSSLYHCVELHLHAARPKPLPPPPRGSVGVFLC